VPDNQEVWTDADKDESVIVEIVERVDDGPSDDVGAEWFNQGAGWFWRDLAEVSGCDAGDVNLSDVRRLDNDQLPAMNEQFAKASIAVGTMKMAKGRGCGDDQKKEVEVAMANVRLPQGRHRRASDAQPTQGRWGHRLWRRGSEHLAKDLGDVLHRRLVPLRLAS
jgi:hypothetical protein